MGFPVPVKDQAKVKSRRCCCICQEFQGRYIEVHHIVPVAEGGSNELDNAITLCLKCHGEVGHFNPKHPIGNKYTVNELRRLRDEWWTWCENNPATPIPKSPILVSPSVAKLKTGRWKNRTLIKVYNQTDGIYYQVIVKFTIQTPGVSHHHITIDPGKPGENFSGDVGGYTVAADQFLIRLKNTAGKAVTLLYIMCLDPHEIKTIKLSQPIPHTSSQVGTTEVWVELCEYSKEPLEPLDGSKGEFAIPFRIPECL